MSLVTKEQQKLFDQVFEPLRNTLIVAETELKKISKDMQERGIEALRDLCKPCKTGNN